MAGHGSRFRYNHKSMVDLQNPLPFPASQYEQTHHGIRTCFIDARCCIKYHMHGLYNSLNKHTRYIEYGSHPPPKYSWWLSHPPLSIESPASRRKIQVLREAMLAHDDRPLLYDKLAMSNTYSHAKNCNDPRPITLSKMAFLESGFSAVGILEGGWLQSPATDGPPC